MLARLRMAWRFVTAVAVSYVAPEPPDAELVSARLFTLPIAQGASSDEGTDVLALVIAWLAAKSVGLNPPPSWALDKRLVLEYKHKGAGPYAIYFDPDQTVGFPPEIEALLAVDDVIIMAESGPEEKDVTELMVKYAGPDGKFGGRLDPRKDASWDKFDPMLIDPELKKGETVNVSFANGQEVTLKYE